MLLTALEIQGFKSFPDRLKITIGKGITAVVGPNGSGKSNISDAIRWVMGETSAKQLRGGSKMENVIFGGTQIRGAMGFAMVNLHIDNSLRGLDIDNKKVVIGRKYYRSGESEYTVNGQNVRLKDIYELLLDTGLGRDGYAVIGQGKIAEIVGAKSAERREIFEEASGISKFRYKKNEAEKRLNSAEDNLVRLRDIFAELERQVSPLEKESKKAEIFIELSHQKKGLEVTLWVDTAQKAKETLRQHTRKIEIATLDYDNINKEIQEIEAQTQELRQEQEGYIIAANRLQAQIAVINEEVSSADTRIAVLNNNIEHNNNAYNNMKQEIEVRNKGKQSTLQEIEKYNADIQEHSEKIKMLEQNLLTLNNDMEKLSGENLKSGQRRGIISEKLSEIAIKITDLKVDKASLISNIEACNMRLGSVVADYDQNSSVKKELQSEQEDSNEFLNITQENITKLENIKNGLLLKQKMSSGAFEEAQQTHNKLVKEFDAKSQRLQMLKDLQNSMEGYHASVKRVMTASSERKLSGIIGPVASILTVEKGFEVAIETALGFAMQNIIVQNETAAKAAIAMLKNNNAGRATFLPLDTVRASNFGAKNLNGNAKIASELVKFDSKYSNIVSNLLGRIIIVEDINEASAVAKSVDYKNRVVTKDGQVINAGGSFTGGSVSATGGMFTRQKEIEELAQKRKQLTIDIESAQKNADEAKAQLDIVSAQIVATESELITANGDKIRCDTELIRINTALNQTNNMLVLLKDEKVSLETQIETDGVNSTKIGALQLQLEKESEQYSSEYESLSTGDDNFTNARNALVQDISQVKLDILSAQKDIQSKEQSIASLKAREQDEDERNTQLELAMKNLADKNEEYLKDIADVEHSALNSKDKIKLLTQDIEECSRKRLEKEGEERAKSRMEKEMLQQRESISGEVARLTEQQNSKTEEYEQTLSKLWEEYELTITSAMQICVEFENITTLKNDVAQIRSKIRALGNVNVNAIEEYKQVKERYEFLREQIDDVEKSKKELLDLILQLSDEMRVMFTQSFNEINNNFKNFFTELFGGGSANLSLEADIDVLECGINIEVAPPGKIIKNLSALSGGEQALVAISIYFAILAVNPAPFCILDEIEAALDDVNVVRFARFLRRISDNTQFIVITHRRGTMEEADVLYGVTMQEDGVSKLLKLDVENVDASLIS